MDDFDSKRFIEEVKIRPGLWDLRTDEYKDQYKKKRLWREVCSAVYTNFEKLSLKEKEIVGMEFRTKWKGFRDSYVRYLRNIKKKGKARKHVKEYVYAPELEFLKPVIYIRRSEHIKDKIKSKVQTTENDNLNECIMKEELEIYDDSDDDSASLIQNESEKDRSDIEKGRPYIINMFKKTSMESVNSVNNCEPEESSVASRTSDVDDDMDFFRSLLPFVKLLPLYKKISFRADIMKIAKEYADNLEISCASSMGTSSSSSTSLMNSTLHQQMYLPVLPIQSLPFQNMNSNQKSSIVNFTKIQPIPNSHNNSNTTSPS